MLCLFGHVLFAKVSVSVSNFGPLQFKTGPLLYCCSLPTNYVASMYYCLLNSAPPRARCPMRAWRPIKHGRHSIPSDLRYIEFQIRYSETLINMTQPANCTFGDRKKTKIKLHIEPSFHGFDVVLHICLHHENILVCVISKDFFQKNSIFIFLD